MKRGIIIIGVLIIFLWITSLLVRCQGKEEDPNTEGLNLWRSAFHTAVLTQTFFSVSEDGGLLKVADREKGDLAEYQARDGYRFSEGSFACHNGCDSGSRYYSLQVGNPFSTFAGIVRVKHHGGDRWEIEEALTAEGMGLPLGKPTHLFPYGDQDWLVTFKEVDEDGHPLRVLLRTDPLRLEEWTQGW